MNEVPKIKENSGSTDHDMLKLNLKHDLVAVKQINEWIAMNE